MGLDVDFGRISKEHGDFKNFDVLRYWDFREEAKDLLYFRKPWAVQSALNNIAGNYLPQNEFIIISELTAYQMLHLLERGDYKAEWWNGGRQAIFLEKYRSLLNTFDFDKNYLFYKWLS